MRFSVEYILMEHELLQSVCGTSKTMGLTIIKADMIRVVKGEISIHMRVRVASPISLSWGYFLQVLEHFCKPETLRLVDLPGPNVVHV